MRGLMNIVNGNFFIKYKRAFRERFTSKPDVSVVEGVEHNLKTEYRLYDEGMFSDASGYLMEISNTLQDDDIPVVLLNRLSVIFRDVSIVAEREGNEKAIRLLCERFGLTAKRGYELQIEAALIDGTGNKELEKRFGVKDSYIGDKRKEIRARYDGFLENKIDSTGRTIMWVLGKYSNSESKRIVLNEVIECLSSQYKQMLFKPYEIEDHVDSACEKLIDDSFIEINTKNVLTLKR